MPRPSGDRTVTIPKRLRDDLKRVLGYHGPWTVYVVEYYQILSDLQKALEERRQDEKKLGGNSSPPTTIVIEGGGFSGGFGGGGLSPEAKANLRASYLEILHSFGIAVTKNLDRLMDRGVENRWSTTNFLQYLRRTPEYKRHFPGIRSQPGQMSEARYNAMYDSFQKVWAREGGKLSREQFGALVRNEVSLEEWQVRTRFMGLVKRNRDYFEKLQDVAKARGLIKPNGKLTKKELFRAMTRRGHVWLERLMEETNVRAQLENIGFVIGDGGDLTRAKVLAFMKNLENQDVEVELLTQKDFEGLAQKVRELLPVAEQVGAGLTRAELFELEFGGPNQFEIARRVEDIIASAEADEQPNVSPLLIEDDQGGSRLLSGTPRRPTSL